MKNNKMILAEPEIRFIKFSSVDVITSSGALEIGGPNTDDSYGGISAKVGNLGGGGMGQPLQ